jgi:hypothetical protein
MGEARWTDGWMREARRARRARASRGSSSGGAREGEVTCDAHASGRRGRLRLGNDSARLGGAAVAAAASKALTSAALLTWTRTRRAVAAPLCSSTTPTPHSRITHTPCLQPTHPTTRLPARCVCLLSLPAAPHLPVLPACAAGPREEQRAAGSLCRLARCLGAHAPQRNAVPPGREPHSACTAWLSRHGKAVASEQLGEQSSRAGYAAVAPLLLCFCSALARATDLETMVYP